jgi:predicted nicotinamide N-methyase
MRIELWEDALIGQEHYTLMNLEHPHVEARVRSDMDAGIAVYYDRRWSITKVLTDWLLENVNMFRGKRVLVLGAGVGAEALVLARHGGHVWVNDLAPAALELCAEQLHKNGLHNFTELLGRYETLELPEVDLVIAGFLIYNKDTLEAMRAFLGQHHGDVLLINERLKAFRSFLKSQPHEVIFDLDDGSVGILIKGERVGA